MYHQFHRQPKAIRQIWAKFSVCDMEQRSRSRVANKGQDRYIVAVDSKGGIKTFQQQDLQLCFSIKYVKTLSWVNIYNSGSVFNTYTSQSENVWQIFEISPNYLRTCSKCPVLLTIGLKKIRWKIRKLRIVSFAHGFVYSVNLIKVGFSADRTIHTLIACGRWTT